MSNKKTSASSTKKSTSTKKPAQKKTTVKKTVKVETPKKDVKKETVVKAAHEGGHATQDKAKGGKSFLSKYGAYIAIIALVAVFVGIIVATKDTMKSEPVEETFISMSVSEWQEKIKGEEVVITTLAQTSCSWCDQFKPVMEKVATDNGLEVVWMDVDTIGSEEEYNKLTSTFASLESFGTPHTVITQNGELLDEISGYVEEDELIETLKKNGAIK